LLVLRLFASGAMAAGTLAHAAPSRYRISMLKPSMRRGPGDVLPAHPSGQTSWAHRSGEANQAGDTTWVYRDSLETRSSPGNEGGYTHQDGSFQPAAWHIAPTYGCQGNAFWCGRIDSTWVLDANRYGYDNNWFQTLENFLGLTCAVST